MTKKPTPAVTTTAAAPPADPTPRRAAAGRDDEDRVDRTPRRKTGRGNRRAAAAAAAAAACVAAAAASSSAPAAEALRPPSPPLAGNVPRGGGGDGGGAFGSDSGGLGGAASVRGGTSTEEAVPEMATEGDDSPADVGAKEEAGGGAGSGAGAGAAKGKKKKKRRQSSKSDRSGETETKPKPKPAAEKAEREPRDHDEGGSTASASKKKTKKKEAPTAREKGRSRSPGPRRRRPSPEGAAAPSDEATQPEKSAAPPSLPDAVKSILHETDHYAVLGVPKTASSADITKAYRRRAVLCHPDKLPCGDRRAFDKVAEAYDVLGDETKKGLYDRYGRAGVEAGGAPPGFGGAGGMFGGFGGGGGLQEELFRQFFGGASGAGPNGRGQRGQPFRPRNRTMRYQLEVTLEDLYNGLTKSVTISQPGAQEFGPHGRRRQSSAGRKTVEVSVPPGMASGQTVTLHGESDHVADAAPADVVFVLSQRRHPTFTCRGHDLAVEMKISLKEALCGFEREVRHLDGRTFVIGSPRLSSTTDEPDAENDEDDAPPVIIQTGDVHVLRGEGMPKRGAHGKMRTDRYGDLYVQYMVEMPSSAPPTAAKRKKAGGGGGLTGEERRALGELLDKLEGRSAPTTAPAKGRGARSAEGADEEGKGRPGVRRLQTASASDFGRASGPFEPGHAGDHGDEHLHTDDDPHHPRGPGRSFFQSFGGDGRSGFHYFSSSSGGFGNMGGGPNENPYEGREEGGNVECQQM